MGNHDEDTKAIQEAFLAELAEQQKNDDHTGLLRFLTEALEADTVGYRRRFKESVLAMAGLVFLLNQFRDTPYEQWAFILVPLALTYAVQRVASPRRPAILEALFEALAKTSAPSPEGHALLTRIEASTFRGEKRLRTACQEARTRQS